MRERELVFVSLAAAAEQRRFLARGKGSKVWFRAFLADARRVMAHATRVLP